MVQSHPGHSVAFQLTGESQGSEKEDIQLH